MKKILFLLTVLVCSYNTIAQENTIPNVEVTNPKGEKVKIIDAIDKLTIIDYWATWCKPCIEEMPYLEEIEKKYNGKLNVISISADTSETPWKKYLIKKKKTGHQYWVSSDSPLMNLITETVALDDGRKATSWAIPRFFLVNKEGEILNKQCPAPSSGHLEALIDQYL
ncbi:TlpA disulfide reductase family protein [uncultured Aquimarina sp.]|uniref:TlpA family protein disulfide reductase n=1 Tax=uncultured Aquimarina sp. TaxID=575652 RepID=UPI002631ABB2|nr:TlpA disulfide reductase family protein [uncultured Aquimarina sp.]